MSSEIALVPNISRPQQTISQHYIEINRFLLSSEAGFLNSVTESNIHVLCLPDILYIETSHAITESADYTGKKNGCSGDVKLPNLLNSLQRIRFQAVPFTVENVLRE